MERLAAHVSQSASVIDDAAQARSVLAGLIGAGIALSRTPRMHEREGSRLGLRYVYRILDIEEPELRGLDAAQLVRAAQICGFAGLNVTYPFKQEVIPLLDDLSENARRVGAVNTIVFSNGRMRGHNTDLWGYAEGFRRQMAGAALGRVAQLGAGGGGSAVSHALLQLGVETLLIADIDGTRSATLAARLRDEFGAERARAVGLEELAHERLDGVVNTSPVGMSKLAGMPVPASVLRPDMWVSDIIYFPLETEFLRTARNLGCRTLGGSHMAIFQAVRAFELITGVVPDPKAMKATFDAF